MAFIVYLFALLVAIGGVAAGALRLEELTRPAGRVEAKARGKSDPLKAVVASPSVQIRQRHVSRGASG